MGLTRPKIDLKQRQDLKFEETSGRFNPYQGLNFGGQARDEAHIWTGTKAYIYAGNNSYLEKIPAQPKYKGQRLGHKV